MAVTAAVQFTQGMTVNAPGRAMFGSSGTLVTVANGDDTGVVRWKFEVLDAPPGSTITAGVKQDGAVSTWSFTPDTTDSFLVKLTTYSALNASSAQDARTFAVLRTSGRFIPPFTPRTENGDEVLNFTGQLRGWSPSIEAWLNFLDSLVDDDTPYEPLVIPSAYDGGFFGADGSGGLLTIDWDTQVNDLFGFAVELLALNTRIYTSYEITLPDPLFNPYYPTLAGHGGLGFRATITDVGGLAASHPVTIFGKGGAKINGANSFVLDKDFGSVVLANMGNSGPSNIQKHWHIVSAYLP